VRVGVGQVPGVSPAEALAAAPAAIQTQTGRQKAGISKIIF